VGRDERAPDPDRADGRGRASDVARDRLGAEVSSEVAATRAAWTDALLRSDAALRHGRPEEARRALDDQRLLLVQLQRRLDRAVSSALVEREAEAVLRSGVPGTGSPATARPGSPSGPSADAAPSGAPAGPEAPDAPDRARRVPRALTGTVAAAVVGVVALLFASAPPPTPEIAAMGDESAADDAAPDGIDIRIAERGTGTVPPPADELRVLTTWEPPVADAPAPDPDDPGEPTPDPAVPPTPGETPEPPERARDDAGGEADRERTRPDDDADAAEEGGSARAEDQRLKEAEEPDGADEGDESLVERLPRVDQSIADRLEQYLDGRR
jgi:hypothetical protein